MQAIQNECYNFVVILQLVSAIIVESSENFCCMEIIAFNSSSKDVINDIN